MSWWGLHTALCALSANSSLSLDCSLFPLIFHDHWFSFEHWVIYPGLLPVKGWANVIIRIVFFSVISRTSEAWFPMDFVLMWHCSVDSLTCIKQCLHTLAILSVTALLGPVSSIWFASHRSYLCTNLDEMGQWLKHDFLARKVGKKGDPQAETPTDSVIA